MYGDPTDTHVPIRTYAKIFDASGEQTQDNWEMFSITKGDWHEIVIRFYIGTGSNDGFYEVFLNGNLMYQQKARNITMNTNIGANILEIATFAGGDSHGWDATVDCWVDMDDVVFFQFDPNYSLFPYNVPTPAGRTMNLDF